MTKNFRMIMAVMVPLSLAACDDDDDVLDPDFDEIEGVYQAGSVTVTDPTGGVQPRELVGEGGIYTLSFDDDGTYRIDVDNSAVTGEDPYFVEGNYAVNGTDLTFSDELFVDDDAMEPWTLKYQRDDLGLDFEGNGRFDLDGDGAYDDSVWEFRFDRVN